VTALRRIDRGELGAGLRRFGVLLAVVLVATTVVSAALGLATGTGFRRAVSLGFYGVGSVLVVGAMFASGRPPVKLDDAAGEQRRSWLSGPAGRARFATADERRDLFGVSWLLLALGLSVVTAGLLVDGRHRLV
jgi:hypothetical protein